MAREPKIWTIQPESEYRFELDPGSSLAITLLDGTAEIFGFELVLKKPYLFGFECKAAVFSWRGCTIEMGEPSSEYTSDETPMKIYSNLHLALEQMRVRASMNSPPGRSQPPSDPPRVMIIGPEHSGKTSLCKLLVNYAVRSGQGWRPMLVNLDPSEGGWAAPGAISAASISGPIPTASPANPLGSSATSAPMSLASHALLPLVYWYGHRHTKKNPLLMDRLIRNLGENINDRFEADPEGRASGLIVDTPASFAATPASNDHRHKLIQACIEALQINTLVVVGQEKLNIEMQRTYGSKLTVVKIPKSGGVVEVDPSYRERVHNYQIHAYMYGQTIPQPPGVKDGSFGGENVSDFVLSPSSMVVNFGDLQIYRIGSDSMAPTDALPVGATRVVSEMQPVVVNPALPGSGLLNAVLAVLAPPSDEESERYDEEILDLHVVGFLIVTNLDIPKKKMTILAPDRGSLVGKTAVVGSYEWQEQM